MYQIIILDFPNLGNIDLEEEINTFLKTYPHSDPFHIERNENIVKVWFKIKVKDQ